MTRRVRSKAALLAGVAFVAAAAYGASTGSAGPAVDTLVVDRSSRSRRPIRNRRSSRPRRSWTALSTTRY